MCQIIGITNIKGLSKTQISTLTLTARMLMSSQKSGFGFAYSTTNRATKEHTYYVEKYVEPAHYKGIGTVGATKRSMEAAADVIDMPMLSSGHADDPTGPIIIHGRTATNAVNVTNTHPFRKKGWAMVHNGVVELDVHAHDFPPEEEKDREYAELIDSRYSSCDSEYLLNTYAFGKGHHDWVDWLSGYAATMTISPNNELIIAKDTKARLFVANIPKLNNTLVFSTVAGYAESIAKALHMSATPSFAMQGNKAIRFSAPNSDNEQSVVVEKFEGMTESYYANSKSSNSLGYNIGSSTATNRSKYYGGGSTRVSNHKTGQMEWIQ